MMIDTVVYYSTSTNNTHKFVEKLDVDNKIRIPKKFSQPMPIVDSPFFLITPTYKGGEDVMDGEMDAIPTPVHKFLSIEDNLLNACAVIVGGNVNFGQDFCIAGDQIQQQYHIPYKYRFELMGTEEDVSIINHALRTW